ncbi:hypothetical protein [Candidatus Poriferisodalis sp.]|uniref:hypothetical protein n=1 Tax=Candidatus Poriferisodalis sp. TaxID=3101277 RepID=UPI003B02D3AA
MRPLSRRGAPSTAQRQNRRPRSDGPLHRGIRRSGDSDQLQQRRAGAPWHFWLVVVMATVYLGWRAVEGVVWLVQWFAGVIG